MKYFKYSIVLLMWLLVKPLAIVISVLLIGLWSWLLDKGELWSYLLAFSPTIIIILGLIIGWVINQFNSEQYCSDIHTEIGGVLLVILSFVPPILISLIIVMYSFVGVKFPDKYDLDDLEDDGIWVTFISLMDC